ncbi:class I SAM-dependent methyltransferase [Petroclostridium sp. X23]|uniref:class I SAM-dependent methyltransferase n=1 Tax=Petroclostridium sp. X23 TaxID=3045146 RepID=UPI0024ACBBFA|nr:class I SAM-dependent methyltransferase [Petroclostridium sp. X23]WHH58351.1 methyltransferase domain-containing protein [Petroclostridium sp. X23]
MYKDQCFLNFDEYFRYKAVAEIIDAMGKKGLSVLDVGGGAGRFLNFLKDHSATSVDIKQGIDGTQLPYETGSFDVVTSIDALEHVIKKDRAKFITEMVRVSRKKTILAFPHSEATEVTLFMNKFTNGWLKEHIEKGLPSQKEVEDILDGLPVTYKVYRNLDAAVWAVMTIAEWYAPQELKQKLNKKFNRLFYGNLNDDPCYRLIYEIDLMKEV